MKLSKNFPLKELIYSDTATRLNIDNRPTTIDHRNLFFLCRFILQPIRDHFGRVDVTSGYRCPDLEKEISGKVYGQHIKGEAADFRAPKADMKEVFEWIKKNLTFGQVIFEAPPGKAPWIHVSLPRMGKENQQALTWDGKNYKPA